MSTQIIITLPDDIYQRAERFARLANCDVASILVDTIQLSIPRLSVGTLAILSLSLSFLINKSWC
ncbi:MAG: hypothetical protein RMZ43_011050 [Nostoc sp. CmiVER01]|uniref:hypothetical protein n=1 Tax=Nostoc sp. CmiVER01 TaxID=3075384 RepID=UPI002AD32D29|nr:hypothetical protein [Nostoc sp. CmiVER01]MDZ8127049.1 hypothetical protein [Nostoc sp. CmiVER01]